jgi:hypothetical protein
MNPKPGLSSLPGELPCKLLFVFMIKIMREEDNRKETLPFVWLRMVATFVFPHFKSANYSISNKKNIHATKLIAITPLLKLHM